MAHATSSNHGNDHPLSPWRQLDPTAHQLTHPAEHFEHSKPHPAPPVVDVPPPHADTATDGSLTDRQREAGHPEYPSIGLPMVCRDLFAEFLGTFVLVLMGLGANV